MKDVKKFCEECNSGDCEMAYTSWACNHWTPKGCLLIWKYQERQDE